MKLAAKILLLLLSWSSIHGLEKKEEPAKKSVHLAGFEVPYELFTEAGCKPLTYLNTYPIEPRKLSKAEMEKLYILLRCAHLASLDRHGQDYFLSDTSQMLALLIENTDIGKNGDPLNEVRMRYAATALKKSIDKNAEDEPGDEVSHDRSERKGR